jgi:endoglucanase
MRFPFIHYISLKLPSPLKEGSSYSIVFAGLNTAEEKVEYTHNSRLQRSDALHVTQVGYRPDDPCKRAYLSIWLGADAKDQALDIDYKVDAFELVEAKSGQTVYSGKPVATKKKLELIVGKYLNH